MVDVEIDHYLQPPKIHGPAQLELNDGEEPTEASEDEEDGLGETATSGSSGSHLSTDTLPSEIDDAHDRPAIKAAANHPPVELFSASFARFIGAAKQPFSPIDATRTLITEFVADVLHPTTSDRAAQEENLLSRLVQLVDPKEDGISVSATARTAQYALLSCAVEERADASPVSAPLIILSVTLDTKSTIRHPSIDDTFCTAMREFDATRNKSGSRNVSSSLTILN